MDLLSEIIAAKRLLADEAKQRVPLEQMRAMAVHARDNAQPHRLAAALCVADGINIIAEFKRRSPSKGEINYRATPQLMARAYEDGGAAAVSVLTEENYFDGSLDDLRAVRKTTSLPILRKDFIVDEYQIYESAAAGGDALLLIVAALKDEMLSRLRRITEEDLGMDALVEVHTREEFERAAGIGARLIGVNNRDLRTFSVAVATSIELAHLAPNDAILVSESGLNPEEVRELRRMGYHGFLVGEALMRAEDPASALRAFIGRRARTKLNDAQGRVRVKICGITSLDDARAAIEAGADMLGFNFYRPSPRFIEPQNARTIIDSIRNEPGFESREVTMVGVFVDETSPEALVRMVEKSAVDAVQLHGDESAEFCQTVKRELGSRVVIKVLRVGDKFDPAEAARYQADAIMIDAFHSELRGGTGRLVNWSVAQRTAEKVPRLFLAGGLAPENVAGAIAAVQPYAVDACSSLESSPGKKNAGRMKEFVRAVRSG